MNVANFFRGIRRRWYLVLIGVLGTVALCLFAYSHVRPTYERTASELLIPGTQSYPLGDNPYLYIGNLTQASDVLVGSLSAEQIQDPILKQYPGAAIVVERDASTSGPMLSIDVTATSDASAAGALNAIVAQVPTALDALQNQAKVPAAARITSIPVTVDTASQVVEKTRLEVVGIVGVVGLVITLLAAAIIDGLVLTRQSRRRAALTANSGLRVTDTAPDDDDDDVDLPASAAPHRVVKWRQKSKPSVELQDRADQRIDG